MKKRQNEIRAVLRKIKTYLEAEEAAGVKEFLSSAPSKEERLKQLSQKVSRCRRCSLYRTRGNPVPGEGNPNASLVFVGEAPGREEDRLGRPFVGLAGKLLTKIIEAMGMGRPEVYIANCLKCRPPENRNPSPEELLACRPHLDEQFDIIRPKIVCALGKFAVGAFLESGDSISRLRGKFYPYGKMRIMPTFHPAYLLRNPSAKRMVWEDMKKIMRELKK